MSSTYPGSPPGTGFDDFSTPVNPEGTPLSEAGSSTRNHPEWHDDAGEALENLQHWAALRTHDHSGDSSDVAKGGRLTQANTHQSPDTDVALTSLHHTLGTGQYQALPGNYNYDWNATTGTRILNRPYIICTSLTRPGSPFLGQMIFETDTNFLQVYANTGGGPGWKIVPFLQIPQVQARQTVPQELPHPGWVELLWDDVVNDTANFINTGLDLTQLVVANAGTYVTNLAVQFAPDIAPNVAQVALFVNGVLSDIRSNVFQRGENYIPGFSQTVSAQGPINLQSGDVVTAAVSYIASQGIDVVNTFVDDVNNLASRISLAFLGH